MKKLLKSLTLQLSVVLMFVISPMSHADTSEALKNLTAEQQVEILSRINTMVQEAPKAVENLDTNSVAEKVEEVVEVISTVSEQSNNWVTAAENAANALITFSSKIGIAASEFITSFSGVVLTLALIFWFKGQAIITFMLGVAFMTLIPKAYYNFMLKTFGVKEDYVKKVSKDGEETMGVRYHIAKNDQDSASTFFTWLGVVLCFILGSLMVLS